MTALKDDLIDNLLSLIPKMDIDQAFTIVGEFGTFQIGILMAIGVTSFLGSDVIWANFIAYNMEHWCRVGSLTDLPFELQKYVAIPKITPPGGGVAVYSGCDMYDLNYSSYSQEDFLHWDRSVVESSNTSTVECHQWVYDYSVMTSTIVSQFDIVCGFTWMSDLVSTITIAGSIIGAVGSGAVSDRFGRRITFCFAFVIKLLAAVLAGVVNNYYGFLVGRFFQGVGSMAGYQTGLVILVEFVGPNYRNVAGIGVAIAYSLGYMSLSGVAYFVRDYYKFIYVWIGPLVVTLFVAVVLPESPRWLLTQGRNKDAVEIMKKVAEINGIAIKDTSALDALSADDPTGCDYKTSPLDLLRTPRIRLRTLVLSFAWFTSSLIFFALSLGAGNLSGDLFLNSFLLGTVEIPANLFCMWSIEQTWFGRRRASVVFFLIAGVSTIVCVPIIIIGSLDVAVTVLSMIGKAGSTAVFNLMFVYSAELYPTEIRTLGLGAVNFFARISGMAAPYAGNSLRLVWLPLPSLLFGIFGTVAGLLCLLLPETLGLELPDTVTQVEKRRQYESFVFESFEMKRRTPPDSGGYSPYNQERQPHRSDKQDGERTAENEREGSQSEQHDNST